MSSDCRHSDTRARRTQGLSNYLSGLSAEDAVAVRYIQSGYTVLERRWRGRAGEIDLILQGTAGLVFVEVKKGRDHAKAAGHLTARQIGRVALAAEEYLGANADRATADVRIDAAFVNDLGDVEILNNITL